MVSAARLYPNGPSPIQSLPFGKRTSTPISSAGSNSLIFTPTRSADWCFSLNAFVSAKCVVAAQASQEWTSTPGLALSARANVIVLPVVVAEAVGKYPHAPPALRQRVQLQSLMNSG